MKVSIKLLVTLGIGIGLLAGMEEAYAYTEESNDPSSNNTQQVIKEGNGKVAVEGWLGTFDPTSPINPEKPQPNKEDLRWIDVTLPTKVLFGTLDKDEGKLYGPKYTITNNSIKNVDIALEKMELGANAITTDLELYFKSLDGAISIPVIHNNEALNNKTTVRKLNSKSGLAFTFKGKFDGTLPKLSEQPLTPKYNLHFLFSVAD